MDIDNLINHFFEIGGSMDECYLQHPETKTPNVLSVVYLNNQFYFAETTKEAIIEALKSNPPSYS